MSACSGSRSPATSGASRSPRWSSRAIVAVIANRPGRAVRRVQGAADRPGASSGDVGLLRGGGSGRYQFWETAVNAFESAPLGGVGASGYTPYWFEHREIPIPATSGRTRCCSRPWRSSGSSASPSWWPSSAPPWSPASAAPGRPNAVPRRRRRWPCSSSGSRRPPSTGPGTCPRSSSRRSSPRRC